MKDDRTEGMLGLFDHLKATAIDEWRAYVDHPFVAAIGKGTLPQPAFRHYLTQDYLFLMHFARAYALAAFKAESIADIRKAAEGLSTIIDTEMKLHVEYCREWRLDEAAMAAVPEEPETLAYTRYVLERGLSGDALDLHVALAPCIVGYGEIGRRLASARGPKKNPYAAWINTYAGDDYQAVVQGAIEHLDHLYQHRGGKGRLRALERTFREATRLEIRFWQMGLDGAGER